MNALEAQLHYPLGDTLPPSGGALELAPGVKWLRMSLPFALDHINLWLIGDDNYFLNRGGVITNPTFTARDTDIEVRSPDPGTIISTYDGTDFTAIAHRKFTCAFSISFATQLNNPFS